MSNVRFDFTGGGSMTRTRIGGLAAAILGLVLLVAAYAKAIDPGLFALQLQDLAPLPLGLAHVLAVLLVGFEAGLGAALVVGWRTPTILLVTNVTFLLFLGVVLWHLWSPGDAGASCGCFGNLIERTPQQAVAEDLLFLGVSGLAWLGRRHEPDPQARRRRLAAAVSVLVGTTPPTQVAGLLQLPLPALVMFPGGAVAWLPDNAVLSAPSETANTRQK